jgi:hypothetical protein
VWISVGGGGGGGCVDAVTTQVGEASATAGPLQAVRKTAAAAGFRPAALSAMKIKPRLLLCWLGPRKVLK